MCFIQNFFYIQQIDFFIYKYKIFMYLKINKELFMSASKKYIQAVHYIINKCSETPERLGAIRLNKILLFVDGRLLFNYNKTLTEDKYIKRKFGPVPKNILAVLKTLKDNKLITVTEPAGEKKSRLFSSLSEPDTSLIDTTEMDILATLTSKICNEYSSNEISQVTHTDVWENTKMGNEIDLYDFFVVKEEYLNEEDIKCLDTLI